MNISLFHTLLFAWFEKHGRVLPWREKNHPKAKGLVLRDQAIASYFTAMWRRDPYRVLISELMLQQTQVDRVLPKFEEFLGRWPTVSSLASAKLSEVMIAWQGLGYNRRARFLHEMAKTVVEKHSGSFPETEDELRKLPGIGEYTSRAILTFAFGKDIGVIDTNIRRIFARVMFGVEVDELGSVPIPPKEFLRIVDESVPKGKGDPWSQALMDFGALICTAKSPKCLSCPLQKVCEAQQRAKREGYDSYTEMLNVQKKNKSKSEIKKPKQKFEETDRYFRGRIVDKLREGSTHMEDLRQHMEKNHGLSDRVRFGMLVEQLVIDKLLVIRGSTASLD